VRETIVVAGALAQKPGQAGHTWQFLQYLLGLRRLGWEVLFLDELETDMCVDKHGHRCSPEDSINLDYFQSVMTEFGLAESCALIAEGRSVFGVSHAVAVERTRRSALLLNVMGYLADDVILAAAPRRVFLDTDPGYGQMWRELGLADIFAGHDDHVTIAENIGRVDCAIPTAGLSWHTTPQPVFLDAWRANGPPSSDTFTSVGAWRGPYAPIELNGITYGLRVHEFRKFIDLPQRTGRRFELALDIDPAETSDLALLDANGWDLVNPIGVAHSPAAYRSYLQSSLAELMVSRGIYVQTRSGWFSERSICYLASGRPVLAQDTGLDGLYPLGEGLLAFRTVEEAADGVEEICADYPRHSVAARELAEAYFGSDQVLGRLLSSLGVA
jgi:hypothetical protein